MKALVNYPRQPLPTKNRDVPDPQQQTKKRKSDPLHLKVQNLQMLQRQERVRTSITKIKLTKNSPDVAEVKQPQNLLKKPETTVQLQTMRTWKRRQVLGRILTRVRAVSKKIGDLPNQ